MIAQQLTFTKKTNAVIAIKEMIQQLSINVDDEVSYSDMKYVCFDCAETLTGVRNRLTKNLPVVHACSDVAQAVACIDRAVEHFTNNLNRDRPKETDKEEIEDVYDLGIDLLNSTLSRLGYWRRES